MLDAANKLNDSFGTRYIHWQTEYMLLLLPEGVSRIISYFILLWLESREPRIVHFAIMNGESVMFWKDFLGTAYCCIYACPSISTISVVGKAITLLLPCRDARSSFFAPIRNDIIFRWCWSSFHVASQICVQF